MFSGSGNNATPGARPNDNGVISWDTVSQVGHSQKRVTGLIRAATLVCWAESKPASTAIPIKSRVSCGRYPHVTYSREDRHFKDLDDAIAARVAAEERYIDQCA